VASHLDIILTLTGGLSAALVLGLLAHHLKMSPIVGYLLAGVVVGPFTPGFVAHAGSAEQFAEVGVILLMFGVGLHFHVRELLAVRRVALPGALVQIAVATGLGLIVARSIGWSTAAGVVFGLAISVASTVVLLRVLSDHEALHTPSGHIAVGWLIVEDVFTVLVLVLLPVLFGDRAGQGPRDVALSFALALLKIGVLVSFTLLLGQKVIPRLLAHVAKTRSRELFTLCVLVLALGVAVAAAQLFGASMALGAFLAGMVVGQSEFSARAASEALPMRDAFAVLFFVAMGMLFDPTRLTEDVTLTLATLGIVLIGKPLAALLVVLALRKPLRTALVVAVALAQIGEFSFILATLARQLEILPSVATNVLVIAAIVSITLNPLLFRAIEPVSRLLTSRNAVATPSEHPPAVPDTHRAIVVGYGPVGRTLTRLLLDNGLKPVVIEMNYATTAQLKSAGIECVFGDAAHTEVLEHAGIKRARSLIFSTSGSPPDAVIQVAKQLNPGLLVLTRTAYVRDAKQLVDAGANVVVAAEAEVALAMAEQLLHDLGATAEQLDRERDRLRSELAIAWPHGTSSADRAAIKPSQVAR